MMTDKGIYLQAADEIRQEKEQELVPGKVFMSRLKRDLSFIIGPCSLESYDHACEMIERISEIVGNKNWIYKSSFDKANRTSHESNRGLGFDRAFYIFNDLKNKYKIPILTDVHEVWHCDVINADVIQIPAFLCRQTDLLKAAAASNKPVNIKKGQFLSPQEMKHVVDKVKHFGNDNISITERGTTFGYNNLVVDMRSFQIMSEFGYPIIMDCTHAVQSPGGLGGKSGGNREFAPSLAYAAIATGYCNGVFMEVHDDPDNAISDGPNSIKLDDLKDVVDRIKKVWNANGNHWGFWKE